MTKTNEEVKGVEKTVEQVKLEGIVDKLKGFLKDENIAIVPKITYRENGIFPDIEVRLLPDPVKNIYDETGESKSA